MSKENLEQFISKVADSEELQAKIYENPNYQAFIALGAECGCEFTAEEIARSWIFLLCQRFRFPTVAELLVRRDKT